jgi:Fe-S-cluster-containing dehydrogenase component
MGTFGNFRVIQDTCNQCRHPVPCATACPSNAIVRDDKTGARVVDVEACTGCRFCQSACPWEMISYDQVTGAATKCFLCAGAPECVQACPAMALQYVPWRDLAGAVPIRQAGSPVKRDYESAGCLGCHPPRR